MTDTQNRFVPSTTTALAVLGRGVFIEIIRRKEFYVLLILTALYLLGALTALIVGIENPQTFMFLINLGITVAYYSAHILVLITAARQVPFEMENRTIYPLLAKPISREMYLLGKWLAITVAGNLAFLSLFLLAWLPWVLAPNSPVLDGTLLLQSLIVNAFSLGILCALALLFSLIVPQGVNMVGLGLIFAFGTTVVTFLNARARVNGIEPLSNWLTAYIPDFTARLNLFTRYTDGIEAISMSELIGLVIYGAIFIGATLTAASIVFQRRTL